MKSCVGELLYRELDYRAEAVNAQRFSELYASFPDVFVPKVEMLGRNVGYWVFSFLLGEGWRFRDARGLDISWMKLLLLCA